LLRHHWNLVDRRLKYFSEEKIQQIGLGFSHGMVCPDISKHFGRWWRGRAWL